VIEVAVEKRLGDFRLDARFSAAADGIIALFGQSGSGKTTLVNAIAGLLRPDRGHIAIEGETLYSSADRIDLPPRRRRVGYVFQEGRLFPHFSVRANLGYGRRRETGGQAIKLDAVAALTNQTYIHATFQPPLLLLHGGGESGFHTFEQQFTTFSLHHRIVAPDQVGQGHTPPVPGPLSYTHMMQDTVAVLQQLNLRNIDVMGFSDGGILALMLAVRHPELVHRLVISGVNIAPEGLTDEEREGLRATDSPRPTTIDEKLTKLWLSSPTTSELTLALLATIHKPVLLISGDRDAITLEHTLQIYRALPQAELCVLPGTDHGTFSGRPAWINPIISAFLDRPEAAVQIPH